jgi:hypothetical protein
MNDYSITNTSKNRAVVIALAVLLAVSLSAVAALVVNRAISQQTVVDIPTPAATYTPALSPTAEEVVPTSTDNQTAEAVTGRPTEEVATEEAPAAIEAPTEEVPTEEVAEGTIGVGDLPAAFVTACGSLEVARDVVGSVFDTIAVGPNVRGEHPSSRLMLRYR